MNCHSTWVVKLFVFIFICLIESNLAYSNSLKVPNKQSEEDMIHQYIIDLLSISLNDVNSPAPKLTIETVNFPQVTQQRNFHLLRRELVDLYWAGTNTQREKNYLPIRVPIFGGLLGHRVSLVHNDNLANFNRIATLEQLREYTACQLEHWPDYKILKANGLVVLSGARFDLMFKMLAKKRCDYFPRSVFEGYSEFRAAQKKYPNIAIADNFILQYDFPLYFFVHINNHRLASKLEKGLKRLNEQGQLKKFQIAHLKKEKLISKFSKSKKQLIKLKNPYLPTTPPIFRNNLWDYLVN